MSWVHALLSINFILSTLPDCANRTIDIRLAGSSLPGSGRIEILVNNQWGTICDVFWGLADAQVACQDLGYSGALQATSGECKCIATSSS